MEPKVSEQGFLLTCAILILRAPSLDPLRVGFPLMISRMDHRPYCKELLGLPAGPCLARCREDPEGHFASARHHLTDRRMDPKVFDISGTPLPFSAIRKDDVVNLRVAVETYSAGRNRIGFHLILRRAQIMQRAPKEIRPALAPPRTSFIAKDTLVIGDDSEL
jgi:hypothetical protein